MRCKRRPRLDRGVMLVSVVLFALVLLSLGLSGYLLWQWLSFRSQIKALTRKALAAIAVSRQELQRLDDATFEHLLRIDQVLPIDVVIPFRERLEVPVQTTVPVDQAIETSFSLQLPGFSVRVPVDLVVPVPICGKCNLHFLCCLRLNAYKQQNAAEYQRAD